jgi:hypothetical protein
MVAQAGTARAARRHRKIPVRGDSPFGVGPVVAACVKAGVQFSLVLAKYRAWPGRSARSPRMTGCWVEANTANVVSATSASEISSPAIWP